MVNKAIKPRIQEVIEIKLFQLIVKSCWKDFRFVVICGWWMKRWIKEWLPRIKAAILGGNVRGRGSWPHKITENYFNGNELNFLLITVWGKSKSVHSPWDYFNTAIKSVDTDFKWWSFQLELWSTRWFDYKETARLTEKRTRRSPIWNEKLPHGRSVGMCDFMDATFPSPSISAMSLFSCPPREITWMSKDLRVSIGDDVLLMTRYEFYLGMVELLNQDRNSVG